MDHDDIQLARDCWEAAAILRHPSQGDPETPPWLAATASCLEPTTLVPFTGLRSVR